MKVSKLVALLTLVVAPVTHADYWVSVASFQSRDNAEAGLLKAQSQSGKDFAVIASETSNGFFYRIAAGPYTSASAAQNPLQDLRDSGYASAWIWQGRSAESVAQLKSRPEKESSLEFNTLAETENEDLFSDDDFFNEDLDALFADRDDEVADQGGADLPKELAPAPANYQLNRLQRD
jgi:hypothetical protein